MAQSREKSNGRRFAGIPHHVMNHPDYIALSSGAVRLLLEFSRQYNSHNNGDLSAAFSVMKARGVTNSKSTLAKLLRELEEKKFILRTRDWQFVNPGGRCALYALTWNAIDSCPGKDLQVQPTNAPPRSFTAEIIKMPGPLIGTGGAKNCDHAARSGAKN
jgi:hypothetical protein